MNSGNNLDSSGNDLKLAVVISRQQWKRIKHQWKRIHLQWKRIHFAVETNTLAVVTWSAVVKTKN